MEKMKYHNIIALCLGIFAAALLWQYYLWPKYQVRNETPEVIAMLEKSAQKELEESIDYSEPGEILFIGESDNLVQELKNGPQKEKDLVFYSQASKPKDIWENMTQDETKKRNPIEVDTDDFILDPASMQNEQIITQQQDDSRITMLTLPSEFFVIKDEVEYQNFLKKNLGVYPKVDFTKEEIVIVISASRISDSFFEIVKIENSEKEIKVFYRVNLILAGKENNLKNYKVIEKSNLPVNFVQVK